MKVIKSYNHLTIEDRRQIYRLSGQRISATIGVRHTFAGRHRSTVFREIQRNRHDAEEEGTGLHLCLPRILPNGGGALLAEKFFGIQS